MHHDPAALGATKPGDRTSPATSTRTRLKTRKIPTNHALRFSKSDSLERYQSPPQTGDRILIRESLDREQHFG